MQKMLAASLAAGLMCVAACSKKKPEDLTKVTKADIAKPTAVISDEEVKQFAADMEKALNTGDAAGFRRLLHLDGMFYRIFPKAKVDQHPQLKEAQPGWKRAVETNIFRSLQSFRVGFVRMVRDGDGIKARFRLTGGGINYWDALLDRNAAGRVAVVDFLDYLAGEFATDGQRRLMQQLMPGLLSGTGNAAKENAELGRIQRISELSTMIRQGRHAEFLKEYDGLDENLKRQRTLMYLRVIAANTVAVNGKDAEVYTQAVDAYCREHPNAVNLELMLIDYYSLGEKYEDAMKAVEGLSRRVGGDPYLDLLRGRALYAAGETGKAREFLVKVIEAYPWEPAAYQTLAVMAAAAEEYKRVTELLIAGEKKAALQWEIEAAEEFAGYRASPEYAKWKARK